MPAAIWPRFTLPIWTLGTAGLSPTSSLASALLASSFAIWNRVGWPVTPAAACMFAAAARYLLFEPSSGR